MRGRGNRDSTKEEKKRIKASHTHDTHTYTHIRHSTHTQRKREKQTNTQNFLVKLFSAAIFFICLSRFSKSNPVAILVFVLLPDDGELLPELLLPELFNRVYVVELGDDDGDGDFTTDKGRPSGVGEPSLCTILLLFDDDDDDDDGKSFVVDLSDDDES
jgi:hypothetical protein